MSDGAFVTGAASGMGLCCVLGLLEKGGRVTGFDRSEFPFERIPAGLRCNYQHVVGDVADATSISAAVDRAVSYSGGLRQAVNAAGITGTLAPLLEQDDDAMDRLLAINVRGLYLSMKYEALALRESGGGSIVNFSSVYSLAKHENMVLYGATKNAVSGLTQGAAVEFAGMGIRVNAVAPGPILTPFIGEITPEIEAAVVSGIPQKRIGRPEEVADVVLWLCSPASSFMTGAIVTVDGGQSAKLSG